MKHNPHIETLLCVLSYGLQCQMVEQFEDALASDQLTKEACERIEEILHQLQTYGEFVSAGMRYPRIRKADANTITPNACL